MVEIDRKSQAKKEEGKEETSNELEHQGYVIRPETYNRFRPSKAREIMQDILKSTLENVKYNYDIVPGNFVALL